MEPGARKGKRSLLACHTRCKYSMETTHDSVKIKVGIKVMKFVENLTGWEVYSVEFQISNVFEFQTLFFERD